jgi:AcrR family transcriptional regulator
MKADGSETRRRLIRAAEHLYARQGIDRVTVKDINALAGQRNESALHYHFGSKEGLLRTILESHAAEITGEAQSLLHELEQSEVSEGLNDLIRILVVPLSGQLGTEEGRDYLQMITQMLDFYPYRWTASANDQVDKVVLVALTKIFEALKPMPEAIRWERISVLGDAATFSCARRARDLSEGRRVFVDHVDFVENLIEMATAALLAPIPRGSGIGDCG